MTIAVYFEDHRGQRSDFGEHSFWPTIEEAIADLEVQGFFVDGTDVLAQLDNHEQASYSCDGTKVVFYQHA